MLPSGLTFDAILTSILKEVKGKFTVIQCCTIKERGLWI